MNYLRKFFLLLLLVPLGVLAQSMSDSQILDLIKRETSAGSSRSQIVTKLVQRGVKIDQIRRVRAQYERQLRTKGLSGTADEAVEEVGSRLRSSNSDITEEITSGKAGASSELNSDADLEYTEFYEGSETPSNDDTGKKVFGHDTQYEHRHASGLCTWPWRPAGHRCLWRLSEVLSADGLS